VANDFSSDGILCSVNGAALLPVNVINGRRKHAVDRLARQYFLKFRPCGPL
jgi:hypothetical protein